MRHLLILACAFALSGCLVEVLTTTAIQGELASENAQSATRALDAAKTATARNEITHAIGVYHAERGEYPPSLEALVPEYLPHVPTRADGSPYAYDPATGSLTGVATPLTATSVPFTTADRKNMRKLETAIYDYWVATGRYPQTLDDLDPLYIERVPRLTAGGNFVYEPETGAVYHPSELAQPGPSQTQGRRAPVGGSGPAGNVVTGIGIQNQLNNIGSSSSATGSAARRSARSANADYNERQLKALGYVDP